jgi:predicted transcriptional regulator of viral defense system
MGHLINVRRGLYARIPEGETVKEFQVDPYLIASRTSPDAVIAYHSALQLLGKTYSLHTGITYLGAYKARPFEFQGSASFVFSYHVSCDQFRILEVVSGRNHARV